MKNQDKDEESKLHEMGEGFHDEIMDELLEESTEEDSDIFPDSVEKPPMEGGEKKGQLSVTEAYQIYESCVDKARTLAQEMYDSVKKSSRGHPQTKVVEPKDNLDIRYGVKGSMDATLVGTSPLREIKTYKVPEAVKKVLNGEGQPTSD